MSWFLVLKSRPNAELEALEAIIRQWIEIVRVDETEGLAEDRHRDPELYTGRIAKAIRIDRLPFGEHGSRIREQQEPERAVGQEVVLGVELQEALAAAQNYLEFRLLAAKARRDGLDKSEGYKLKAAFAVNQVLAMEYLGKEGAAMQAKAVPTDEQVKAYYETHKAAFKTQGKFNARHILVKTKGGPNAEGGLSEEDAKKKMAEIQAEFAKGGKWDDLAKKYSEDPGSKDKGGLYEGIVFGQFVPEFEAAVKKQDIGKVGEPVKSMFGFHLIQVESRNEGEDPGFDKVKEQVKQRASGEAQEKAWKDMIDGIKKEIPFVASIEPSKATAKPAGKEAPKAPRPKPAARKPEAGK